MRSQLSFEEKLNFLTIDILEALDIYPEKATTDLIENILQKHLVINDLKYISNQNKIQKIRI